MLRFHSASYRGSIGWILLLPLLSLMPVLIQIDEVRHILRLLTRIESGERAIHKEREQLLKTLAVPRSTESGLLCEKLPETGTALCSTVADETSPHLDFDGYFADAIPCVAPTESFSMIRNTSPSLKSIVSRRSCTQNPLKMPLTRGNIATEVWQPHATSLSDRGGSPGAIIVERLEIASALLVVAGGDIVINEVITTSTLPIPLSLLTITGKIRIGSIAPKVQLSLWSSIPPEVPPSLPYSLLRVSTINLPLLVYGTTRQ